MPETVTVNAAEIARLAGVGRAAVSNWRRRHDDFPDPAGGTDASPVFSLTEVEDWLRAQGKLSRTAQRNWIWPHFDAMGDRDRMGRAIAAIGAELLDRDHEVPDPADADLIARAVELARAEGAYETFEFLRRRWLDTHVRQISATPAELSVLMASLALSGNSGESLTILDPACGSGSLLAAAARLAGDSPTLLGQEADPTLAGLASVRLAFEYPDDTQVLIATGDSLRADAHTGRGADAVICNPPFNERNWGQEELSWDDPRWRYGVPPRTESELAWTLHALGRLRPGGTAVVLMPPAVAARKAGRRIRNALVQNGALRAVVALPPGAAPPHGVALHLWILRATDSRTSADSVLMIDAAGAQSSGVGKAELDWPTVSAAVLDAWRAFDERGGIDEKPGVHRAVRSIDLLDGEVDLTPARHIPQAAPARVQTLFEGWSALDAALHDIAELSAALRVVRSREEEAWPQSTIGELIRSGHLTHRSGSPAAQEARREGQAPPGAALFLTLADLVTGAPPSGWIAVEEIRPDWAVTGPGDLVIAPSPNSAVVHVAGDVPIVIGARLEILGTEDPEVVDPWFLAGCLRSSAGARQAATHASTTSRIDIRRIQIPRLPHSQQCGYGAAFRRLGLFQEAVDRAARAGNGLAGSLTDALASGSVAPEGCPDE